MSTRYLVLDTETTGLESKQGHKIIEIGCVELIDRRLTGKQYQQYLNPEREIDDGALAVHGIEPSVLFKQPIFAQIAQDFITYIKGATLLIHNAAFDIGFLNHELNLLDNSLGTINDHCEIVDTLTLAREKHPGQRNSLDALCQRYQINNAHRTLHGALLDAEILAEVYLVMTGGQLNLIDEPQTADMVSMRPERLIHANQLDYCKRVIDVDDAELVQHKKWLELLSVTTGESIKW